MWSTRTYRLIEPARAVSGVRPGWDIRTYAPRGEVKVHWHQKHGVVDVVFPNRHPWPDVLVMQRTGTPILAGVAAFMQKRGTAVVADFDDAMWTIDKANIAYGAWNNPNRHRGQHWSWCDQVAERADLVTVTTEHLARRYGRHGRCVVLPNRIPDRWVVQSPTVPVGVAGWAGYLGTHPGDCKVSAPAARVFGEVRVMGEDPANMAAEWGTDAVTGIPSAPLGPEYYQGLSGLGTMLVGLRDTSFNKGKSTLKVLEAAAAGVPSIAADTPPHRVLQREGFPVLLAENPERWEFLAKFLRDPENHREHQQSVREALPAYTMSAQAELWAQAWERAVNRRSGTRWANA